MRKLQVLAAIYAAREKSPSETEREKLTRILAELRSNYRSVISSNWKAYSRLSSYLRDCNVSSETATNVAKILANGATITVGKTKFKVEPCKGFNPEFFVNSATGSGFTKKQNIEDLLV